MTTYRMSEIYSNCVSQISVSACRSRRLPRFEYKQVITHREVRLGSLGMFDFNWLSKQKQTESFHIVLTP